LRCRRMHSSIPSSGSVRRAFKDAGSGTAANSALAMLSLSSGANDASCRSGCSAPTLVLSRSHASRSRSPAPPASAASADAEADADAGRSSLLVPPSRARGVRLCLFFFFLSLGSLSLLRRFLAAVSDAPGSPAPASASALACLDTAGASASELEEVDAATLDLDPGRRVLSRRTVSRGARDVLLSDEELTSLARLRLRCILRLPFLKPPRSPLSL